MFPSTASASRPCSVPALNHKVRIALAVDQDSIFLDGEVRWAHEYTGPLEAKPREVGIFIHKPPADYLRLVAAAATLAPPVQHSIDLPLK